jgi:hypothetical protein
MNALHRQKAFFAPLFPHKAKVCNAPLPPHFFRFITKKPLFLTIYFAPQKFRPRFAKPSILGCKTHGFALQYAAYCEAKCMLSICNLMGFAERWFCGMFPIPLCYHSKKQKCRMQARCIRQFLSFISIFIPLPVYLAGTSSIVFLSNCQKGSMVGM